MRHSIYRWLATYAAGAALVAPHLLHAQNTRDQQRESPEIRKLTFSGVKSVDQTDLRKSIGTQATKCRSMLLMPFCWISHSPTIEDKHYLDQTEFERDVLRIRLYYWKHGYRDATVDTTVSRSGAHQVHIAFTIHENQPTVVRRVVSEATARQMTQILEGVVAPKGTAPLASVPGLKIAGKTGTAQKVDFVHGGYSRGRIASFVGYFPADDPQLVMLVVLDEPQTTIWGGTAAAPVFRSIALAAAERLSISVDPPAKDEQDAALPASSSPTTMANAPASFLGLSLREAIDRARVLGVAVDVVGSGYVVRQDPPPNAPLAADQPIRLQLDTTGGPLG